MQRRAEPKEEGGAAAPARAERAQPWLRPPGWQAGVWRFVRGLDYSNEKLARQVNGQQGGEWRLGG